MSKFHAWNVKVGSLMSLWTFLKKVFKYRKALLGGTDDDKDDDPAPAAEGDTSSGTVEHMMQQLKALQRGKHTLELACCIFADARVRTLGYMTLGNYSFAGKKF